MFSGLAISKLNAFDPNNAQKPLGFGPPLGRNSKNFFFSCCIIKIAEEYQRLK